MKLLYFANMNVSSCYLSWKLHCGRVVYVTSSKVDRSQAAGGSNSL